MSEKLIVKNFEGYFYCSSKFGQYHQTCDNMSCIFEPGVNILSGDVDSGCWSLSYALSSENGNKNTMIFTGEPEIILGDKKYSVQDFRKESIYLDKSEFSARKTVRKQIESNLKKNFPKGDSSGIRALFCISDFRYERNLNGTGNEVFKCLSAIGYSCNKFVYCFPWMSAKTVKYLSRNLTFVLNTLSYMNKIVIFPTNSADIIKTLGNNVSGILDFNKRI